MNLYKQNIAANNNPNVSGCYNTDKGLLFWFEKEKKWSCRVDRVSIEEYPKYWYELVTEKNKATGEAEMILIPSYKGTKPAEANAELIAAAPKMINLLQVMFEEYGMTGNLSINCLAEYEVIKKTLKSK